MSKTSVHTVDLLSRVYYEKTSTWMFHKRYSVREEEMVAYLIVPESGVLSMTGLCSSMPPEGNHSRLVAKKWSVGTIFIHTASNSWEVYRDVRDAREEC